MSKDYGTNENAKEIAKKIGEALRKNGDRVKLKIFNSDPLSRKPIKTKIDYEKKYNKLGMAIVQMLNYMDMENGNIVVREYELNILENLIKDDFGYLIHGDYSNIGVDQ